MRESHKIYSHVFVALLFVAIFLEFLATPAFATTYYVDINSVNPTPPYTNWSTASTDIQSAVNQTTNGDLVLVNPGVYQSGGETVNGYGLTNRVAITTPITVESVDGPSVTTIGGYQVPSTTNGADAVRCLYMTNNAVISGFTLSNGATLYFGDSVNEESGGGVFCATTNGGAVSNCVLVGNSAYNEGGGAYGGTFVHCIVFENQAQFGGGFANSLVFRSLVISNTAYFSSGYGNGDGGGAYNSALFSSALVGNNAANSGGELMEEP
jgi:hypothetical protein